jgi:hypothetical protein
MRRVGHEVIKDVLQLNHGHVVALPLGAMGLGMRMELKIRETVDEADALEVVR